jgi:hypothetical protein
MRTPMLERATRAGRASSSDKRERGPAVKPSQIIPFEEDTEFKDF